MSLDPQKTVTIDNAKRYLKFNSNGVVSDLLVSPQDPQYITNDIGATLTFKFPSTFPSGEAPDTELGEGTTLTVDAYAYNTAGSTGHVQATVQPEGTPPDPEPDGPNLAGLSFLYYGSDQAVTITNGIDLANTGGLVWLKNISSNNDHALLDSPRITLAGFLVIVTPLLLVVNNTLTRLLMDLRFHKEVCSSTTPAANMLLGHSRKLLVIVMLLSTPATARPT